MNNNKDFSEQINELFEDLSLDEASKLIESELTPTEEEVRKEVIENINKNDIKVDENILSELRDAHGEEGVLDYLRQSYGLKAEDEVKQELEVVEPKKEVEKEEVKEDIPTVGPKDYQSEFINNLSGRLSKVLNQQGMRAKQNEQVGRVEADPDARIDAIQQQLNLLRGSVMESTMVSGIGQGGDGQGPGSGEVRLNRLDDVHIPGGSSSGTRTVATAGANKPNNGDILIWDDSIYPDGGWTTVPGDDIGGGINGNLEELNIVFGKVWSSTAVGANVPLFWDTEPAARDDDDPNNPTGELVVASLSEFKYMVSVDAVPYAPDDGIGVPNIYQGTWHIVGGKLINGDPVPVITVHGVSADANLGPDRFPDANGEEIVHGVYFREGVDAAPIEPDFDPSNAIVGHFVGCRETAGPSALYWGTAADYNDIVENGPSGGAGGDPRLIRAIQSTETDPDKIIFVEDTTGTDPSAMPIVATEIIACIGTPVDTTDATSDINWEVIFADGASKVNTITLTRPRDTNEPPFEGPFLYATNAPCVSGGISRVRTDDVYLAKLDDLSTTLNDLRLYGSLPIDLTQFEFQDSYNELLAEISLDLHMLKPTMLVAEYNPVDENVPGVPVYLEDPTDPDSGNIDGIHDLYVPIKGDLWLDPRDNTLRACLNATYIPNPRGGDRPDFTAEWVVVSGEDEDIDITTDQVTLINTVRLYEFYSNLPIPTRLTEEEFLELFPLSTQEDANLFNIELLKILNEIKPTIHVTPDIYSIEYAVDHKGNVVTDPTTRKPVVLFNPLTYIPKKGDIWIDSQYRMFICDYAPYNHITSRNLEDNYPYLSADKESFAFWVEVGAGAGEGAKVYIQRYHPENARTGDLWIEDTTYFVFVLSPEGTWVALTGDASAMGRSFKIHVDINPPGNARQGDCWYDTVYSDMKIYLDGTIDADPGWYPVSSSMGIEAYERTFPENRTITALNYQVQELTQKLEELEQNIQQQNSGNQNFTLPISDWVMDLLEQEGSDILEGINTTRGSDDYDGDTTTNSDDNQSGSSY